MLKFAFILLLPVLCRADNVDEIQKFDASEFKELGESNLFDQVEESDEKKLLNEKETLDDEGELEHNRQLDNNNKILWDNGHSEELEGNKNNEQFFDNENVKQGEGDKSPVENEKFDENEEFDNINGIEDDQALENQVKYLDTAREALIKFSADLRKGKNVTNAFLKVINGFEKRIANFQASLGLRKKIKPGSVEKIQEFIKEAAEDRKLNTLVLRELAANGLLFAQISHERTRAKRADFLLEGATAFLESIKEDIGDTEFDQFLSIEGLVTLIFVIDTTGSMGGEIGAAIAIATQIVKYPRDVKVDYILSPFNDPGTGPVTVKNETQGEEFIQALKGLRAFGGGDCPEFALTGMLNGLEESPQPGSSMYVFTDASAKDPTKEDDVINAALDLDIPINFFSNGDCGKPGSIALYERIADKTKGIVYPLKTTLEIEQLGKLVANNLRGSATIGGGGSATGFRKRAVGAEYKIPLDDSIEKVTITITTHNSGAGITLVDPEGKTVNEGRTNLTKGAVYDLTQPNPGVYKLIVPVSAGAHKYRINAISGTNIDFGHYYTFIARRGRNRIPVPIEQPLQGLEAAAFVTIAGAESVNTGSLTIKVVDKTGNVHHHKPMKSVGTSGVRFIVKFIPPSGPFKLELHGKTKKGNTFVRTSAREEQAVPVTLRLAYTENSYILYRSKTTNIRIQIRRGKTGNRVETYTVAVKDKHGYGKVKVPTRRVRKGRIGFARITFTVPGDASKGKTLKAEITLTKKGDSKPSSMLILSLLIV